MKTFHNEEPGLRTGFFHVSGHCFAKRGKNGLIYHEKRGKIYDKLLEWKRETQGKRAILIEGARRIGKSTICEEFAIAMGEELLVSHAFDENELLEDEVYKQILAGKLQINEGMLYENVIAQMLVVNGHKLYFYTHYNSEKHRNDIEIDFLISNNSKLKYKMYPIEVRSGKQYTVTSLTRFREKYKSWNVISFIQRIYVLKRTSFAFRRI